MPRSNTHEGFGSPTSRERRPDPGASMDSSAGIERKAYALNRAAKDEHKPRVLVLPAIFAVGGVERNTAAVMRQLADRFRFVVVTNERHTEEGGCLLDAIVPDSEAIFDLASISPRSEHLELLREICGRFPPDLVWVCNGSVWYHENIEPILTLFGKVPLVDQQVYDWQEGWVNHLTASYVSRVARLVAINSEIRKKFINTFDCADKIDLIYHAIDTDRLPAPARSNPAAGRDGQRVSRYFFIGRLTDQKRPLDLIETASIIEQSGETIEIVMIGNGPLAQSCAARVRETGVSNISMRPFTDRVADIYAEADAIIFTSAYEGLPIVMLESLASGVPVISTDVGDIRRVADELGGGCMVVDEAIGHPDRMASALLDFDRNLSRYQSEAIGVAATVRQRFGSEKVASDYFECWAAAWQAYADRDVAF